MSGDMQALAELIARVQVGWATDVMNHDYIADSGRRVIDHLFTAPAQTYTHEGETHVIRSGGPGYFSRGQGTDRRTFRYQFPVEGDDFEVEGNTLRIYNPSHPYVHGNRAVVLTITFRPPVV